MWRGRTYGATARTTAAVTMNGFFRTLGRDAADPLLRNLLFGAERVFQIMTVFSSALLVEFVGATADFIFNLGNGSFALH
jgi:hypothetical protein